MTSLVLANNVLSCASKIPYEIIKSILDIASSLVMNEIWCPTMDLKTGKIRNRFNRFTCNRNIIRLHHMLRFKKKYPPRFHSISIGFYILDGQQYPCVEYTLSRESSGYQYSVGLSYDETYSLSRRYIVVSKDETAGIFDYIYLDSQYEFRDGVIARGIRRGFLIRDDDDNYDYDSINEINVYETKYNMPWDMKTHGRITRKYDVNSWNWEYSQSIVPPSDFDDFGEDADIYDEDYSCLSFRWNYENTEGGFGRFARYDQIEIDTIQMIW